MNETKTPLRRSSAIDLLKTIAIICVILIHSAGVAMTSGIGSPDWYFGLFWGTASRFAVPVFFMCSGALMLRPGKELSLKKLWGKSILRLVLAMLFWAFAYKCFHLLADGSFSLTALWQAVKEILLFNQEFHLYYLHIILLVYALLPALRLISANADRKTLRYLLVLWFLLGILFPTLSPYWPLKLLTGIPQQWALNMTYSSIGYCFLGYYLTAYPPRKKGLYALLFIAGFGLTFGLTAALSLRAGALEEHFLEGMGVPVFLMATGVFGLCSGFTPSARTAKVLTHLSKASFCIYLTHAFFLPYAQSFVSSGLLPVLVSIPLAALGILALCLAGYEILSRVPWVNKWLI